MFKSGVTTLEISNEEMNGIMKIVKSLEESGLLTKGVSRTIKSDAKNKKSGFLSMFSVCTLGASLLGNLLTWKDKIRAGEGIIRADQTF